jgi:hypothetical protein
VSERCLETMLLRLTVLVVFAFVCGCYNTADRPKDTRDAKVKPTDEPLINLAVMDPRHVWLLTLLAHS